MRHFVRESARQKFLKLLKECPWFDPSKHFMVVLADDCNLYDFTAVGETFESVKKEIKKSFKYEKDGLHVDVLKGSRLFSWTL